MRFKVVFTQDGYYKIFYGYDLIATCITWGEVKEYLTEHEISVYDFYYERRTK